MLNILRTLLWREWRNERKLFLGMAGALPFLLISMYVLHIDFSFEPYVLASLAASALAADCMSSDASGRRLETLCALPLRPLTLWSAKLIFILSAIVIFTIMLVVCDRPIAAVFSNIPMTGPLKALAGNAVAILTFALLAASCVSLTSIACGNPLGGLVAGVVAVVGLAYALKIAGAWFEYIGARLDLLQASAASSIVILMIAAASAGFFCYLRARIVPDWKGFATRSLAAMVIFGVAATGVYASIRNTAIVRPGEPGIAISDISASPDGKFAACRVHRNDQSQFAIGSIWIIRISDGTSGVVDETRLWIAKNPWVAPGSLRLLHEPLQMNRDLENRGDTQSILVDAETAAITRRSPASITEFDPPRTWAKVKFQRYPTESRAIHALGLMTISWPEMNITKEFKSRRPWILNTQGAAILKNPGQFLACDETGRLVLHNLNDGTEKTLRAGPVEILMLTEDTSRAIVATEKEFEAVDIGSGRRIAGPWSRKDGWSKWIDDDATGRFIIISRQNQRAYILDTETGSTMEVDIVNSESIARLGNSGSLVFATPGGRIRIATPSDSTLRELSIH